MPNELRVSLLLAATTATLARDEHASDRWTTAKVTAHNQTSALKCGVASANFPECPACMKTLLASGKLGFWWNWDLAPKMDETLLTDTEKRQMHAAFTPMLWGQGEPPSYAFLSSYAAEVQTYNEPDQYGPACVGDWDPPAFGCSKGEYRAATSAGWQPLFDPSSAAGYWQKTVQGLAAQPAALRPGRRLISPSMAQGAEPTLGPCVGVDPSVPGAQKICPGWLAEFKKELLALTCPTWDGGSSNCWDVIDVLSVHAYDFDAKNVLAKLDTYHQHFADDFAGTNGRTRKSLWLTEVAMASSEASEVARFARELMDPKSGLHNRDAYGYVEKVSWFSSWAFSAFNVSGRVPRLHEMWSSNTNYPSPEKCPQRERLFLSIASPSSSCDRTTLCGLAACPVR